MPDLDNPSENPCFGCGPANDRGLQLSFERREEDGEPLVATTYTPGEDEIGWPGFIHGGLHFLVLYEISYWTALELGGSLMTQAGRLTFEQPTVPRTDKALEAKGRIADRGEGWVRVEARTTGTDGRPLGRLAGPWSPVSREQAEAAGIDLPAYLLDEMQP